ncbi:DUF806 family protein [Leuconostoc lactis]|uniref:DUF806 family protein n=1 Tax=Leuconostoc lactis TaxID=1246 RepID=UPI00241F81EB|nr:DUF806 family protein [Leuconostoc lactis]
MTIVMQAKALLESLTAPWVDDVYPNIIPDEVQDKVDTTIIFVRPAYDTLADYGSDTFGSLTSVLSIQIFYAVGNEFDYDVLEYQLYKGLEAQGFRINDIKGRLVDLDTNQDYQTFTLTKNRTLKG